MGIIDPNWPKGSSDEDVDAYLNRMHIALFAGWIHFRAALIIQQKLRDMVNQGLGPKDMAEVLVAGAIAANLKPDDISVVVALVK